MHSHVVTVDGADIWMDQITPGEGAVRFNCSWHGEQIYPTMIDMYLGLGKHLQMWHLEVEHDQSS